MAEIMRLLGNAQFRIAALQPQLAAGDSHQTRDQAKQRRFSGAIPSGHDERFTPRKRKIQAGEHLAAAADAGKIGCNKPHQRPRAGCEGKPNSAQNFWRGKFMRIQTVSVAQYKKTSYK